MKFAGVVIAVCCASGLAFASDVEGALTAVHDAQKAADEGGGCKGLSTRLKLAAEAVEDAKKATGKGQLAKAQQAKGRVENAKDAAGKACSDAAKAKVTASLDAAIAALDKPEPKVAHQGAAFGGRCSSDDGCADEHCYADANPPFCSKVCEAPKDCPAGYRCRRVGSVAYQICTK